MKKISFCISLFFLAIIIIICWKFGSNIPFSVQWPLYEALRNTSAIIFGVTGAWLAILYPGKLSIFLKGKDHKFFDQLVQPLFYSILILATVLFIGLFAPIIKHVAFFAKNYKFFRSLSYAILGGL
jgi:hypothetical protein